MIEDLPSLALMRRYLRSQGWTHEALKPVARVGVAPVRELDIYIRNDLDFGELELVLPKHSGIVGTPERVEQALRTLSGLMEKPIPEVAEEVRGVGFDKIEAALPNPSETWDTIPLRVADTFLRQTRALLVFTAVAEYEARSADAPGPAADQYGDACRFGHTFHGSFGFRILSPVGPHEELELDVIDGPPPPERQIVRRLRDGFHAVTAAVDAANPAALVNSAHRGFGADSCFALARLLERAEAQTVKFDFNFSPEWLLPAGEAKHDVFEIPTSAVQLVREAGRELRVKPPEASIEIRGRVVRMKSEFDPADLFHPEGREIGVRWSSDDFGDVNVRIQLTPQDYDAALEAHRRGRDVVVKGVVESWGRSYQINKVEAFRTA